jgi:site-specific DNA-cytosine methylase
MAHYAKSLGSTLDEPVVVTDENRQTIATASGEESDNGNASNSSCDVEVRRLTPVECERLQGFPDDWTFGQSDVSRYRMLGNAVAVPVVEWIAKRLVEVDERMESGQRREGDSRSS